MGKSKISLYTPSKIMLNDRHYYVSIKENFFH